jgi:hypothetical protein
VNKKKQKNFDLFDVTTAGVAQARRGAKVFLVLFFQKKNFFLPLRPLHLRRQGHQNRLGIPPGF